MHLLYFSDIKGRIVLKNTKNIELEAWVRQNCTPQFPVSKILLTAPLFCQCTTVNTDSTFPSNLNDLAHDMTVFSIYLEVIFELIKSLDPNKVHG